MVFHLPMPGRAKWIAIRDSQDYEREFVAGRLDDENWYPATDRQRQQGDPIPPGDLVEIIRAVIDPQ